MQSKIKKTSKIVGVLFTILLLLLTPVLFASCGASKADLNSASKFAKSVAQSYFTDHVNYANFADTTYSLKDTQVETSTIELEYAKNDENVKESFTNSQTAETTTNLYVKKISESELGINLTNNQIVTSIITAIDKETKQPVTTTTVTKIDTIYNLAPKTEDDVTKYYLTKVTSMQENDKKAEVTKLYKVFKDQVEYSAFVNQILLGVNEDFVLSGWFSIITTMEVSMMLSNMIDVNQNGNNLSISLDMNNFNVQTPDKDDDIIAYYLIDYTSKSEIKFTNKKIDSLSLNSEMKSSINSITINQTAKLTSGAEVNPSITIDEGFTKNDNLKMDDLPRVSGLAILQM